MLVAFDAGKTTFRHGTFKEYKGGRQKTPPELSEQMPFIRELLDAYQSAAMNWNNMKRMILSAHWPNRLKKTDLKLRFSQEIRI